MFALLTLVCIVLKVDEGVKPLNNERPGAIATFLTVFSDFSPFLDFFGDFRGNLGKNAIKLGEFGVVHRAERSGQLHGLMRVREFTQDDAHIFCEVSSLGDEIAEVLEIMDKMYATFGLSYELELSTRPADSIGSDEIWEAAEGALREALEHWHRKRVEACTFDRPKVPSLRAEDISDVEDVEEVEEVEDEDISEQEAQFKKLGYRLNPGDGAFYGPKIDVHVKDSMGRSWQCGTIQVDFNLPARFGLEEIVKKRGWKDIVMVHRVVYGSMERFMGILIEHFKGRFPLWLSPIQVVFIGVHGSVGDGCRSYIRGAFERFRVGTDFRNETVSKRIRAAAAQRIPYIVVLGAEEEAAFAATGNANLRVRVRGLGEVSINSEDFLSALSQKIASRSQDLSLT